MIYYDFVVRKENMSLRIIYKPQELEFPGNIKNLENFYIAFKILTQVLILLIEFYSVDSDIEYIDHKYIEKFLRKHLDLPDSFEEIFEQINAVQIKNIGKKKHKENSVRPSVLSIQK